MPKKARPLVKEKLPKARAYVFGRPTKYKPEYCQMMLDYFNVKPAEVDPITKKLVPNNIPTIFRFAYNLGLNDETLLEWSKIKHNDNHEDPALRGQLKYPDFSAAYNKAKQLQKEFLSNNALKGLYPPASFIFVAKNVTDMKDQKAVDHTTNGKDLYPVPDENQRNRLKDLL